MSEAKFQAKVKLALEERGWYVMKTISCNRPGWPDLMALKRGYPPLFIEVKGRKTPVSKLQLYRHQELRNMGFKVRIIREP